MTVGKETDWLEMRVADVRRAAAAGDVPERHVVLLEEAGGGRRLALGVGPFEATALAMSLEGVQLPRPGPYSFVGSLLAAVRSSVREVRLTRLSEGTFYAEAVVDGPDGEAQVDARPSDVLNLALVVGAPIRANPAVVEEAAGGPYGAERVQELGRTGAAEIVADARATWEQAKALAVLARDREQGD